MTLLTAPIVTPSIARGITADELLNMEDNVTYELVDGQLRVRNVIEESSRIAAPVAIVDPINRLVMIHRRDGSVAKLYENDEITGESAQPVFSCKVTDLLK